MPSVSAPGHGPAAAIADYDRAIETQAGAARRAGRRLAGPVAKRPRRRLHEPRRSPSGTRRDTGRRRRSPTTTAPSSSCRRCATRWATTGRCPWRNDLAAAFMNRGIAKQSAPGHGPAAAIADYDRAIELRQALRDALGDDWPVPWRNDLAAAFMNRGSRQAGRAGTRAGGGDRRLRPRHRTHAGAARRAGRRLAGARGETTSPTPS